MLIVQNTQYTSQEDLIADITAFQQAIEEHKFTENIPAPLTNELVECIVRMHNGKFQWVVETPDGDVLNTVVLQRRARYQEETDPLFMRACEDYTMGSEEWNTAINEWKIAKARIREELSYPE